MKLLILLALLSPPKLEWGEYPAHTQIAKAKLIFVGDVIEYGKDKDGRLTAIFQINELLKGKVKGDRVVVPFKTTITWSCDFKILYEKKKYLLLIDDANYFRVVYYPGISHVTVKSLDDPAVRFTRAVLKIQGGTEVTKGLEEIAAILKVKRAWPLRWHNITAFLKSLPRKTLKPILSAIRKWEGPLDREKIAKQPDSRKHLTIVGKAEITRDLSLIPDLLKHVKGEKYLLKTVLLMSGRTFTSRGHLKDWWDRAVRRIRKPASSDALAERLELLESEELPARDEAVESILDMGPAVLDAVRKHGCSDAEIKNRIAAIVAELELMREVSDDLGK